MNINLKETISTLSSELEKHSPAILIGVGIVGFIASGVLAVTNTPKALDRIDDARRKKARENPEEEFTKVDVVKSCWKQYAGPVVIAGFSAASIIASAKVSARREMAAAALLKLTQDNFSEFKEKTKEVVGEEKVKKVEEEIAKNQFTPDHTPPTETIQGRGSVLCKDMMTGRYFWSDMNSLVKVENLLNKRMIEDYGYISLNELYDELYMDHCEAGEMLGWHVSAGLIVFETFSGLTDDGVPYLLLKHNAKPDYRYS